MSSLVIGLLSLPQTNKSCFLSAFCFLCCFHSKLVVFSLHHHFKNNKFRQTCFIFKNPVLENSFSLETVLTNWDMTNKGRNFCGKKEK
jgi:hypothetical protein